MSCGALLLQLLVHVTQLWGHGKQKLQRCRRDPVACGLQRRFGEKKRCSSFLFWMVFLVCLQRPLLRSLLQKLLPFYIGGCVWLPGPFALTVVVDLQRFLCLGIGPRMKLGLFASRVLEVVTQRRNSWKGDKKMLHPPRSFKLTLHHKLHIGMPSEISSARMKARPGQICFFFCPRRT